MERNLRDRDYKQLPEDLCWVVNNDAVAWYVFNMGMACGMSERDILLQMVKQLARINAEHVTHRIKHTFSNPPISPFTVTIPPGGIKPPTGPPYYYPDPTHLSSVRPGLPGPASPNQNRPPG